jgi:hypothetical protein
VDDYEARRTIGQGASSKELPTLNTQWVPMPRNRRRMYSAGQVGEMKATADPAA